MPRRPAKPKPDAGSTQRDPSASSRERRAALDIERLRSVRVRPDRGRLLGDLIEAERRAISKSARTIGPAGRAWASACPPDHLPNTIVLGLQRGVLRIGVSAASSRYALDRWLRAGGEMLVIRGCGVAVRRVALVAHAPESGPPRDSSA